jgi:hypothetical protein
MAEAPANRKTFRAVQRRPYMPIGKRPSPDVVLRDYLRAKIQKHQFYALVRRLYALPGATHSAFAQFRSIRQDA